VITNRLLYGCIVATTGIVAVAYLVSQSYAWALLAVALGTVWLFLEITNRPPLVSLFFLAFLSLAALGSLQNLPASVMLLGVSTNLAAWDLSRFRARIKPEMEIDMITMLERNHIQKLAPVLGIGFVLGLIPLLVTLSINFVALMCVVLLAMLVLRISVISLQDKNRDG
jgi:hypothetical protein